MLRAALPFAMVASAAAFAPAFQPALRTGTTMSMSMDRRQVVQGAALAGAVAPFLGGVQQASAAAKMPADSYTPIITIFDARGCPRGAGEYQGSPAGDNNDEMAVKVVLRKLEPDAGLAEQIKAETLGLMSKGPTQVSASSKK